MKRIYEGVAAHIKAPHEIDALISLGFGVSLQRRICMPVMESLRYGEQFSPAMKLAIKLMGSGRPLLFDLEQEERGFMLKGSVYLAGFGETNCDSQWCRKAIWSEGLAEMKVDVGKFIVFMAEYNYDPRMFDEAFSMA